MAPNWFIAFPAQVESLHLPPAPPRVRVFGKSDLHVTIAFLGAVGEIEARRAWERTATLRSLQPVNGSFSEIEPLGHPRKPSAIAALVGRGFDVLSEMIEDARPSLLAAAEARPDERPPLPHVTVARVQRRASSAERRAALRWAERIDVRRSSFAVDEIALYTWSADRQARLFDVVERRGL